jgi:hypothetical protein
VRFYEGTIRAIGDGVRHEAAPADQQAQQLPSVVEPVPAVLPGTTATPALTPIAYPDIARDSTLRVAPYRAQSDGRNCSSVWVAFAKETSFEDGRAAAL